MGRVLSRRSILALLAANHTWPQGISSRGVKPQSRGKPSGLPFHAHFVDIGKEAGLLAPSIYGAVEQSTYIVETVGCGVAFFDYDNDGWLDILVLSGTRLDGAPPGTSNRLYKNNRDGTFTNVTERAGLLRTGWANSVTVGDYNNDGHEDLFVTYWGQNVLYRNNGNGTFTDVTKESGLLNEKMAWGSGCTWIDYDRNGHLDLFVANYVDFDLGRTPKPGMSPNCNWKGIQVMCGPRGLAAGKHKLYRNDGDGTFTDVTSSSGIGKASGSYAMTSVAADFNGDGWPDIYVACDSTPSFLFVNQRDGTFSEEGLERGAALSEDGMEQAGMGLGVGDFDCDGDLDIFKTHFADDTHVLYKNDGKGNFEDVTVRAGLGVETRYIAWGAGIVDLDNDGLPDLFAVTGNVYPELEKKLPQYPHKSPRFIFRNLDKSKFEELIEEAGPGVAAVHASRGCAFGDFDNDGDLDILIMNMNEPPSLLRNDGKGAGNWLKVRLIGTKSNRSAIGSCVTARYGERVQVQEVLAQSSYYSVNDRRLHFGLGKATQADLAVRWTNGLTEQFKSVESGYLVEIQEGIGIVRRVRYARP